MQTFLVVNVGSCLKWVRSWPGDRWPRLTSSHNTWVQFPAAQPLFPVKSKPMQQLTCKIPDREISAVVTSWAPQVSFSKKTICHFEAPVAKNLLLTTTKLLQIFTGVTTSIYILGGTEKVDFRNCYFQCWKEIFIFLHWSNPAFFPPVVSSCCLIFREVPLASQDCWSSHSFYLSQRFASVLCLCCLCFQPGFLFLRLQLKGRDKPAEIHVSAPWMLDASGADVYKRAPGLDSL